MIRAVLMLAVALLAGCNEHDAAQWLMTIAVYGVAFSPVWLYFLFH